jgi:hypothetical protein
MSQPLKVATPAVVVSEQFNTEPLPVVTASATAALLVVTVLPNVSWIVTTGCLAKVTPATVLAEGCVVMMSLVGVDGVMVNAGLLTADARPPEAAVTT